MRKALVVGIDQYPSCPLHGCCNDADSITNILSQNEDGSPNFDVRIEKNVTSKARLRELIEECFAGDPDIALFYYSGHGYMDSVGGFLVTPDYTAFDYGVSLQDVLTIGKYVAARREVQDEYEKRSLHYDFAQMYQSQTERFYDVLKRRL